MSVHTVACGHLPLEDIDRLLECVVFRPFAQYPWDVSAEEDGASLLIRVTNRFARDSTGFDPFAETDDWTVMDAGTQDFTRAVSWPTSEAELRHRVAETIGYAAAHEALEWCWWGDDTLVHDAHRDGDVSVRI